MPRPTRPALTAVGLALALGTVTLALPTASAARPKAAPAAGDSLAQTPPMGWNSWNKYHCDINEQKVRAVADAIVAKGLDKLGYAYVTVDDCWMAAERDAEGNLVADPVKFPSGMKALGDYLHAKGLKFGIYQSPTQGTCQRRPGSYGHEQQDANSFAAWGVDYLKYDWCQSSATESPQMWADFPGKTEKQIAQILFPRMREALDATGRPIVYSLSNCCSRLDLPDWAGSSSHLWRTSTDIYDAWRSVMYNFDKAAAVPGAAGPGHWNDPDMLEVGNGGMTDTEYRSHFSLWAQLAAPMIMGNDLSTADGATLRILGNQDVLAVDQDALGEQGTVVRDNGTALVMTRRLATGDRSVTLTNKGTAETTVSTTAAEVGLGGADSYRLKDLWSKAVTSTTGAISAKVPAHGTVMYRITPNRPAAETVPANGTYKFGLSGGRSVDVPNSTTEPDTQLIVWPWHHADNQRWQLTRSGNDYTLKSAVTGLCADVRGNSTAAGGAVIQYRCTGNANQRWTLKAKANGYTLQSVSSGLALTATADADGAKLTQQPDTGAKTQVWFPTRVD